MQNTSVFILILDWSSVGQQLAQSLSGTPLPQDKICKCVCMHVFMEMSDVFAKRKKR